MERKFRIIIKPDLTEIKPGQPTEMPPIEYAEFPSAEHYNRFVSGFTELIDCQRREIKHLQEMLTRTKMCLIREYTDEIKSLKKEIQHLKNRNEAQRGMLGKIHNQTKTFYKKKTTKE